MVAFDAYRLYQGGDIHSEAGWGPLRLIGETMASELARGPAGAFLLSRVDPEAPRLELRAVGESGLGPPLVVSGAGDLSPDDDLWGFDQAIAAEPGGRLHLDWRSAGAAEAGDLIYRRLEGSAPPDGNSPAG